MTRPDRLFGRTALVEELCAIAADAKARGRPEVALVTGPPGYGKTHIAAELYYQLERAHVAVVRLRPGENTLLGSRATTRQILRSCLDLPEAIPADGGAMPAWIEKRTGQMRQHPPGSDHRTPQPLAKRENR